jgi:hypothetical protein
LWAELAFIGSLMTFNKFEFFPMGENFDFFWKRDFSFGPLKLTLRLVWID